MNSGYIKLTPSTCLVTAWSAWPQCYTGKMHPGYAAGTFHPLNTGRVTAIILLKTKCTHLYFKFWYFFVASINLNTSRLSQATILLGLRMTSFHCGLKPRLQSMICIWSYLFSWLDVTYTTLRQQWNASTIMFVLAGVPTRKQNAHSSTRLQYQVWKYSTNFFRSPSSNIQLMIFCKLLLCS